MNVDLTALSAPRREKECFFFFFNRKVYIENIFLNNKVLVFFFCISILESYFI